MGDLRHALERTCATINQVILSRFKHLFYTVDTLEPYQFKDAGSIPKGAHEPSPCPFSHNAQVDQLAGNLHVIRLPNYLTDRPNLCFINMPEREKFKKVLKTKNTELLFEKVCPQGTNAFEVFYRAGQYIGSGMDGRIIVDYDYKKSGSFPY